MSLFQTLIPALTRTATPQADATADLGQTVKPAYDIKETPEAFAVTVHLPDVAKDGLELTIEETGLRIVGRRAWQPPTGWTSLYRETTAVPFALVLTHDHAIDADKATAELRDGVLRLSLPKPEAVKPRKIAVN